MKPGAVSFHRTLQTATVVGWAVAQCGCSGTLECATSPTVSFPSNSSEVDWSDIVRRAELVLDATCPELSDEDLEARYGRESDLEIRHLDKGTRYVLLTRHEDRIQELFLPGTNFTNLQEVLADLSKLPVFDPELEMRLHHGFHHAASLFRNDVFEVLRPEHPVRITGYSLGGASAVILAMQLALDGFDIESVLTFGQPKVTDVNGAARMVNFPLLRIKSGNDGISNIFPTVYRHFGDQIVLLDGDRFAFLSADNPNYDRSTDFDLFGLNLTDHTTYRERLSSKLIKATPAGFCEVLGFQSSIAGSVCAN